MKTPRLTIFLLVLTARCSSLFAQNLTPVLDSNSGPIRTPSVPKVQAAVPDQPEGFITVPPPRIPVASHPIIHPITIYRMDATSGILVAKGAEITLPGINNPMARSINLGDGRIEVADTASDGTLSFSAWDISSLTNPYMPQKSPTGGYIHNGAVKANPGNSSVPNTPNLLPGEMVHTFTIQNADLSTTSVPLGGFVVDDANRIFYTPPVTKMFIPKPRDVFSIDCVTHTSLNNKIVVEWSKGDEDNYHVVIIDVPSRKVVLDFATEDDLQAQRSLTWIDKSHLLGKFSAHTSDEFTIIDMNQRHSTSKATTAHGELQKVWNHAVITY